MGFSDAVKILKVSLSNLKREEERKRDRALMHNLEFGDGVMIVLLMGTEEDGDGCWESSVWIRPY